MTTYLLDTNMFSYIASGRSKNARAEFARLAEDPDAELCISVITEAEVRFGMHKRALSPSRRAAIEGLFANFEILAWGSQEAAIYGATLPKLNAMGISVSLFDFMIGVHAATTGAVLVSHDGIFARIAEHVGITAMIDWAKDL